MNNRRWVSVAAIGCLVVAISVAPVAAQATAKQAAQLDAAADRWAKALKDAKQPFEFYQIAEESLLKMEAAARVERFETADRLGFTAVVAAGKAGLPWLKQEVTARKKEIDEVRTAWEAAKKMRSKGDEEGNLVLGKYLCFVRGDWEVGLGKLMMSSDEGLKDLAWKTTLVKDDPAELVKLGDAWWEKSTTATGKPKSEFQTGAVYLYAQALPTLTQPESDVVVARMKEAAKMSIQGKILPSIFEVPMRDDIALRLRRLSTGRGLTGSPPNEPGRDPAEVPRPVQISKPLYIGVTEVTQDQWSAAVRQVNPSRVLGGDLPAHNISWNNAQAFLSGLNRLPIGKRFRFRLPTSAEWEYACRAGTVSPYFYGGDGAQLSAFAWSKSNSGDDPHPVAKLRPNAWGLYDMLGNVMEWTDSTYDPNLYPVPTPTGASSNGLTGEHRLARGGSFLSPPNKCRCASIDFRPSVDARDVCGLRVVCEPITPEILTKP